MRAPLYSRYKKVSYYGVSFERLIIVVLLVIIGSAFYFNKLNQSNYLPKEINKSVNFRVYGPSLEGSGAYRLDAKTLSFSKNNGVLIMNILSEDGNRISVTQQTEPESFTDVPQYYPKLLNSLNEYAEFQTAIGTVTLTKPDELKGGQSAVSRSGGTLLFAHPERNMSDSQWKDFFNSFEVVK